MTELEKKAIAEIISDYEQFIVDKKEEKACEEVELEKSQITEKFLTESQSLSLEALHQMEHERVTIAANITKCSRDIARAEQDCEDFKKFVAKNYE